MTLKIILKGGEGSGHKGHAGRPGSVGGSVAGTGGVFDYRSAAALDSGAYRKSAAGKAGMSVSDYDAFTEVWRDSYVENSMPYLSVQQAISDKFGVTMPPDFKRQQAEVRRLQSNRQLLDAMIARHEISEHMVKPALGGGKKLDRAIDVMYSTTQKWLRDNNISELRLYRGGGAEGRFRNPASSWTSSRDEAEFYGNVVSRTIPAGSILSLPFTGFGDAFQQEVVVIGNY